MKHTLREHHSCPESTLHFRNYNMTHFIERKHLIQWLAENCTRKSVVRAMDEGSVENLGTFSKLGPNNQPGWIVLVTAEKGKAWKVEVASRIRSRGFGIYITSWLPETEVVIPWEDWDGNLLGRDLYDGDNPTEYRRLRDERRAETKKENRASEDT